MAKSKKPRVSVIKESDTGRNQNFVDNKTGDEMTRAQFVKEIDAGKYPDYHVRSIDGVKTPASNPNNNDDDNLG
ncbi:hypothetical protein ACU6U9_02385 [Pseudomonas sp. HK3]